MARTLASIRSAPDARLDERMTVGAEQHALARLRSHLPDAPRDPTMAEMKVLRHRISMMELKGRRMLIKSTQPAAPTSLGDQSSLDPAAPLRNRRGIALDAPESPIRALEEECVPVPATLHVRPLKPRSAGCIAFPATRRPLGFELELLKPVANRGIAGTQSIRHPANRPAFVDHTSKPVDIDIAFWRMPCPTDGDEPMLLEPVADCGRVPADGFPNCVQ